GHHHVVVVGGHRHLLRCHGGHPHPRAGVAGTGGVGPGEVICHDENLGHGSRSFARHCAASLTRKGGAADPQVGRAAPVTSTLSPAAGAQGRPGEERAPAQREHVAHHRVPAPVVV